MGGIFDQVVLTGFQQRRPETKKFSVFIFLLLFLSPPIYATEQTQVYKVTRVVDGDTIIVNGYQRVRLIGVDTPEYYYSNKLVRDSRHSGKDMSIIMALGKIVSMFTKQEILGQQVKLEYDWQKKDRYGRTLAYVFRQSDNLFLNAEIIKQGYGNAYTRFPFKYLEEFRRYEREARAQKKGLWADNRLEGLE